MTSRFSIVAIVLEDQPAGGHGGLLVGGGDQKAAGVAEADARQAAAGLDDVLGLACP